MDETEPHSGLVEMLLREHRFGNVMHARRKSTFSLFGYG